MFSISLEEICAQLLCCPLEKLTITAMSDTNVLKGKWEGGAGRVKKGAGNDVRASASLTLALPLKRSHWLFTLIIFEINAGWCLLRTLKRRRWAWLLAKREAQCMTNVPPPTHTPAPSHVLLSFLSKGLFNYLWYQIRVNLQPCQFM